MNQKSNTDVDSLKPPPAPDDAAHILIVDDDRRIRTLLSTFLREHQYRVSTASNTAEARQQLSGFDFQLIILDVMMPGESGLEFTAILRQHSTIPILMLSARDSTEHRIEGLERGVDDYLPKPFEPRELLLRVKNILKRSDTTRQNMPEKITIGEFIFHLERGELQCDEETIRLTTREREILRLFAASPGKPIGRAELTTAGEGSRAVDVQINRLRQKIEPDPSNPVYLQTVRGSGYILYTD